MDDAARFALLRFLAIYAYTAYRSDSKFETASEHIKVTIDYQKMIDEVRTPLESTSSVGNTVL